MTKNQFVAGKLGIAFHYPVGTKEDLTKCSCGYVDYTENLDDHFSYNNPDFSTNAGVVQLLRLMRNESRFTDEQWADFSPNITCGGVDQFIDSFITTPGALLDAVAEFFGWDE